MKFFVGLLLIGAAASTDLLYPGGKEYQFDYEGKIMSGIPELGSQYAGLTIKGQLILQSQDGVQFKLGMKNPQFVDYNDQLAGQSNSNWRNVVTPQTQEVPAQQKRFLETPVEFRMQNGQVSNIKVSENEPQWATNFKKALIAILKVQVSDQGVQGQSPIKQAIQQGSSSQSWKVMEQDLIGTCENDYTFSQIKRSSISKQYATLLQNVQCQSGKLFQVIKSKNIDRCLQRSVYMVNQPGHYECPEGNCPPMWGRTSVTRFIGCKDAGRNELQVKLILNEGEVSQSLFGHNGEQVINGVKQTLLLTQAQDQMTNLPEIQNPRTLEELFFEHTKTLSMLRQQSQRPSTLHQQQMQLQNEESDPRKQRYAFTLPQGVRRVEDNLKPENIKTEIIKMLETVLEDLSQTEDFQKTMAASKILSLTELVSLLTTQEIESVWNSVESGNLSQEKKSLGKQMIWELAIMSGTNPSIMFILDSVQKNQVNDLQIVEAVSSLPHYIRTPTKNILQELFKFIQSPSVSRTNYIKYHANMAFATILKETCIDSQGSYNLGESAFGSFCTGLETVLKTEFIPYFAQHLNSANSQEDKRNAIFILGLIAHDDILPIILPYVEGTTPGSTPQEQRIAIYALNSIGKRNKKQVLPLLSAIVNNKYEDRSLRIAALTIALDLRPDLQFFQRLAASTWYEEDNQFQKFVFATIANLQRVSQASAIKDRSLIQISKYAQAVLSLAKPVPSVISSQLSQFIMEWFKQIDVGYQQYSSYYQIGSTTSYYMKLEYFLQKLRFVPLEVAVDVKGLDTILDTIKRSIFPEHIQSNTHTELAQMLQKIDLLPFQDTQISMLIWTKFFGNINLAAAFGGNDVQKSSNYIKELVRDQEQLKRRVCGQTRINMIKLNNMARYQLLVPSDMGLPVISEVQMPTAIKLTGHLDVQCGASLPSVKAELRFKIARSFFGQVATFSPFTLDWISAGIDKQVTTNIPTNTKVSFEQGRLKIAMAQSDALQSGSSNLDLVHYSVKPFTVKKPIFFLDPTPSNAHSNVKYIQSQTDLKTADIKVGRALGLDLSLRVKAETDVLDLKSLKDYLRIFHYNPYYIKMFLFAHGGIKVNGKPTLRYHDATLVMNPSSSSTKELEIDFAVLVGKKQNSQKKQYLLAQKDGSVVLESSPIAGTSLAHKKLEESLEKLNAQEGYAVSTDLKIEFRGNDQQSLHYIVSVGQGQQAVERKWNLDIVNQKNPSSQFNLCVEGKLVSPRISWEHMDQNQNVGFSFYNKAGFGQNCEENKITVTGSTAVSHQQNNLSQSSKERKQCRAAQKMLEKLQKEIKHARDQQNWNQMEQLEEEERRQVQKEAYNCERYKSLASTLDEVKFNVEYTKFTPRVKQVIQSAEDVLEALLIPYVSSSSTENNRANTVDVKMNFIPLSKSFNMEVRTPQQTIQYRNVRFGRCPMSSMLPFNARTSPAQNLYKKLSGSNFYPKCSLKQDVITTFNNQSYAYHMDDCYHVAISDCSSQPSHAVLVKNHQGQKQVKLYIHEMSVEIQPQTSTTQKEYQVIVDGQQQSIQRNEKKEISSSSGKVTVQVQKTQDDILIIDTPFTIVKADGKSVQILKKDIFMSSKHCGLCGNHDDQLYGKLKDAKQCLTKTERAAALSFRVQQSCSDLSEYHKRIQATEQTCAKVQGQKIHLTSMLPKSSQQCSQSKHSIVVRGNEHCISQDPILECGAGCAPRSEITKRVGYACLPTDRPRLAELYEEKVRNGEFLPELKSMTTRFSVEKTMPLSCTQINI